MFNWLKNLVSKSAKIPKGCCGGGCCGHKNRNILPIGDHEINNLKNIDAKIVVGKIREIFDHPDPKITKVRITKTEIFPNKIVQILCGAENIEVDQIIPVATLGAKLGENFEISKRDIRGEDSHGMLCAKDELGLEKIDDGIWVLPESFEIHLGKSLRDL